MKLDLNTLKQKTFELTLLDGETINIKRPSKEFIMEIESFKSDATVDTLDKSFENMEEMCLKVLNANAESKKFTKKYLKENKIDYLFQTAIFNAYFEFVQEVMRNPN